MAIFAADVEGFSRLMGADEVGTFRDLTERRRIMDELIASHRGRIANTAGDSVLAEFGSAVDAVQCAVAAQEALANANSEAPASRKINFRIGVHVGDEAIRAARKAIELGRRNTFVLGQAGWTLALLADEVEQAGDYLERATTDSPNSAFAWSFRGAINVLLGNHEEATEYCKRALRLSPLDSSIFSTYTALAQAAFFLGRYEEALRWAELARRANPRFLGTHGVIIAAHALLGHVDAARKAWEAAQQISSVMRISMIRERFPLRRDQDVAKLAEGYRLAGVPE